MLLRALRGKQVAYNNGAYCFMYPHLEIEAKWQAAWADHAAFCARRSDKPKFYVLDMFPYPSGTGLHVGHLKGYVASDVIARYKRARGFEVLHPMGWDSFGLPAERQAQRENASPEEITRRNVAEFRRQLQSVGLSYDWSREVATSEPRFYRWTQWIFCKLFEHGLAYMDESVVNWCPALSTVLANEEVQDGVYKETGDIVERREMKQWKLRITAYADRLIDDLELVDWPEPIKRMQLNWIGRSTGALIKFKLVGSEAAIDVFTTRPDTIFGVSYLVVAPEHQLLDHLDPSANLALASYVGKARATSDMVRQERVGGCKTGCFTGQFAIHPFTGEHLPVWTADYVLGSYGAGAVMAVPGHDQRDFEFACTFGLPIRTVVAPAEPQSQSDDGAPMQAAYEQKGVLIASAGSDIDLNGLSSDAAASLVVAALEERGSGGAQVSYRLKDWLFSRQRYWGEPIPMLFDEQGHQRLVAEEALPVLLPALTRDGTEPLNQNAPGAPLDAAPNDWLFVELDGRRFRRETNTMPQWAGSCWYYLRFIDPDRADSPVDADDDRYWMPVDLYVGGAEHATLHLLYARFWHKFLFDIGVVSTSEPFKKLFNQGMVRAPSFKDDLGRYHSRNDVEPCEDGWRTCADHRPVVSKIEKMSKSKYNGVHPDEVIAEWGADALRLYEMFMGPVEDSGLWDPTGMRGTRRFLDRIWALMEQKFAPDARVSAEFERQVHRAVKAITNDIENFSLNTAISQFMSLINAAYGQEQVGYDFMSVVARMLQPFAPHFAEDVWHKLGETGFVFEAPWPDYDPALCEAALSEVVIQVGGKRRGSVHVPVGSSASEIELTARQLIRTLPDPSSVRKLHYVPERILNFVI